ncbi:heterokaryon incompatibility protein-domain-containing protein [Xylariaceae sp. FL0662B]|nr:heterokaryon incompatibility protein-domain-containing protein [Xylariaceae sp. FL0662B]
MQVVEVSVDNIISNTLLNGESTDRFFDIFRELNCRRCSLDCHNWQQWQHIYLERTKRRGQLSKQEAFQKHLISTHQINQQDRGSKPANRKPFLWQEIEASARSGCECCELFKSLIEKILRTRQSFGSPEDIVFEWVGYSFRLRIVNKLNKQSQDLQVFCVKGSNTTIRGMISSHVLTGNTSGEVSLRRARDFVNRCEITHTNTCGTGRDTPLPTRVLDLTKITEFGEDGIHLKLSGKGEKGTYACLSYRWGDPSPPMTLESNIHDHCQFIKMDGLPKTFRDAVSIARMFGLKYLWIDSLCIVQKTTDFDIEGGKMADIYRNAFLTIAAVSAPTSWGGCYSAVHEADMCVRVSVDRRLDCLLGVREDKPNPSPLFKRAWVCQERILSRRILYCTQSELQFQCYDSSVCECGNASMHRKIEGKQPSTARRAYEGHISRSLIKRWHRTVTAYSRLDLSYGGDKLPALSGCAKDFAGSGGRYLAGLWEKILAEGLLWIVEQNPNPNERLPPRPEWRAPTWSWASVDTPAGITFLTNTVENSRSYTSIRSFRERIKDIQCLHSQHDPHGIAISGHIKLKASLYQGYVRQVCLYCQSERHRGKTFTLETSEWHVQRKDCAGAPMCSFAVRGLEQGLDNKLAMFGDYSWDKPTSGRTNLSFSKTETGGFSGKGYCSLAPVWLLYLHDSQKLLKDEWISSNFMVLMELPDQQDTFERVGLMRLSFEGMERKDAWFTQVLCPQLDDERSITLK